MFLVLVLCAAMGEPTVAARGEADAKADLRAGLLLAGPRVSEGAAAPSLVRRGADGRLIALEDREEIEAVELLGLDGEEREPIDRFLRLRLADVMSGGLMRVPLVLELQAAIASGEPAKVDDVLARYGATRPIWAGRESVERVIESALPERTRAEYRRLIEEYREQWLAEQERIRPGLERSARMEELERSKKIADIRRPNEANLERSRARFEEIARRLDLSPEQEGRLLTLFQEYATNTNYKPTRRDGLKLLSDLFGTLTWSQRVEFLRAAREERGRERFRPVKDAPKGTGLVAGVPLILVAARRKRKRNKPPA